MSIPHFPGWTSGRLSPRTIALAVGRGVLGLLVLIALVASGCDRDPTETAPEAPASSPSVQPAPSTRTPKLARVPAVEGLGLANAKRKLRAAGLEVGEVDRRPSTNRKDTVLKQGVAKGTELEPGSSVPLVVAAPLPRVPSVIGKPEASAIRSLKNAGFKVKTTTQTTTSGQDGVVLSQSPRGGTRAKPNSVVGIVISNVQRSSDAGGSRNCTPGYSPCLPPASDYDCDGGNGNGPKYTGRVRVTGPDPYDLDRDGDGVGCDRS
jgi:resuscitation-promoting factor RpfB